MKPIYTATGDWDAQMVRDILVTRGIDAVVEDRFNPYPVGTGEDRILIVNDEDEARAMEIMREFHPHVAEQPQDTPVVWTWRCPNCREEVEAQFELCWNCGRPWLSGLGPRASGLGLRAPGFGPPGLGPRASGLGPRAVI